MSDQVNGFELHHCLYQLPGILASDWKLHLASSVNSLDLNIRLSLGTNKCECVSSY